MIERTKVRNGIGLVFALGALVHCYGDGGLNRNERSAGNTDDGVAVGFGEIAIDPTGKYLISSNNGRLMHGDLQSGATRKLSQLTGTTRVAFDHAGSTLFATLLSVEVSAKVQARKTWLDGHVDLSFARLVRYDVGQNRVLWSKSIELAVAWEDARGLQTYPYLELTDDDQRLIVTFADRVEVLAAKSGEVLWTTHTLPQRVVDVDLTPDQKQLVITLDHTWDRDRPTTVIQIRDLITWDVREISVPNCADELAITADQHYALLAPTTCKPAPMVNKDPVSVIDLEQAKFVRNLPGFGPVALAAGGSTAVAFMDLDNLDPSLFPDKAQLPQGERYQLMLIDTESLEFEAVELGDSLPRYALSPDGQLLLVDAPTLWKDGRVRILDVASKQLTQVKGPSLQLDNYVMTSDSAQVFLIDGGLYRITLADRTANAEPIDFSPTHLNITPDDHTLVLRENANTLWLYDASKAELGISLTLDP